MIGLGVGIDYSLFIVTRFRQLLHDGLSPREAAAGAAATAGRAVIFAGITVAISILGLFTIGIGFITVMGIGGALGVLTSVILANTLLPAVLAMLGHKIDRGGMKLPQADESFEGQQKTPVARWGRFVTSHARAVFIVALVALPAARCARTEGAARLGRRRYRAEEPDHAPGLRHPLGQGGRLRPRLHVADHGRRQGRQGRRRTRSTARSQGITGDKGDIVFVSKPFANPAGDVQHHQRVLEVLTAGLEDG